MVTLLINNPLCINAIGEDEAGGEIASVTENTVEKGHSDVSNDSSESGSLMLSPAEMDAIGVPTIRKGLAPGEWRLDGIIYNSEEDWTIWLNTDMYSPNRHPDGIMIMSVKPGEVQIQKTNQMDAKQVTLCLNQCVKL